MEKELPPKPPETPAEEPELKVGENKEPEVPLTLEEAAAKKMLDNAAQNMANAAMAYFKKNPSMNFLEQVCNVHLLQAQLDVCVTMLTDQKTLSKADFWANCAAHIEQTEGNYRRAALNSSIIQAPRPGFRPGKEPKKN